MDDRDRIAQRGKVFHFERKQVGCDFRESLLVTLEGLQRLVRSCQQRGHVLQSRENQRRDDADRSFCRQRTDGESSRALALGILVVNARSLPPGIDFGAVDPQNEPVG